MDELKNSINSLCDKQVYDVSWFIRELESGETIHRDGNIVIPSASTRKVAILMTALQGVNAGKWALHEQIPITSKYQEGNFIGAILDAFDEGLNMTFKDHLIMMITLSDNVSTGIIVDKVGLASVNEFCDSLGLDNTRHRVGVPENSPGSSRNPIEGNVTTPNDQGKLLTSIIHGCSDPEEAEKLGVNQEQCNLAINILKRQKYKRRLPSLLPLESSVAHKTGTVVEGWTSSGKPIERGLHDIGIVFNEDEPKYVICVFTTDLPSDHPSDWPPRAHASHTIGRINAMCWDYLIKNDLSESRYSKHT